MDLRLARDYEDLLFLYTTRRHPLVAIMLSGKAPESIQQHTDYINKVQEKSKWIFIASSDEKNIGYGQIYDVTEEQLEVGFVIHPDFQGKGFGKKLVNSIVSKAKELFPNRKIILYVKKENFKAIHIYEKCGFVSCGDKEDTLFMELKGNV